MRQTNSIVHRYECILQRDDVNSLGRNIAVHVKINKKYLGNDESRARLEIG